MQNNDFPICERCSQTMTPIYFIEEEYVNGFEKTGRKRTAVSHFECPYCGEKACIDDTFDGPWHY